VIPKTCSACGVAGTEKLASLYWAWMQADRRRVAYKQKLCASCVQEKVLPALIAAMEPVLVCPMCHIGTVDDHDDVFLTICPPGMPKTASEWPLCGPCAVEARNFALLGAARLEDRQSVGLGADSSPQPVTAEDTWAAMGLDSRFRP
jgi:hypothetical protein